MVPSKLSPPASAAPPEEEYPLRSAASSAARAQQDCPAASPEVEAPSVPVRLRASREPPPLCRLS